MSDKALLRVHRLAKTFRQRSGSRVFGFGAGALQALRDVTFDVESGETVGVVGESGSGKSTLGRCALGLLKYDAGQVWFDGTDLRSLSRKDLRTTRRHMQLIFQDPSAALNPRMSVSRNIEDPLRVHKVGTRKERFLRVERMLERVGLQSSYGAAFPFELSGGQQQRVMIARALILSPKLVVCDEALSALDLSVQAQVMDLLQSFQRDLGLSYLFISHNLGAVGYLSHKVAVMYLGEVVEFAPTDALFHRPRHPYTQNLVNSILHVPTSKATRAPLRTLPGEVPSTTRLPSGCAFHTRCPVAIARCRTEAPRPVTVGDGHQVSCHLA